MARIARVVIPNNPHHIIQRGNRRQNVFFSNKDKITYLNLLNNHCNKTGIDIWAYCLMTNHVHIIAVPKTDDSLARGIGEAHRKYTCQINEREKWRGYLWQGRFLSYPLDEAYLYSAVRYVERNPVRAGIVEKAEDYKWSSAGFHVKNKKDSILKEFYLMEEIKDWGKYLLIEDKNIKLIRKHSYTGRPLGDEKFIKKLEKYTGRILMPKGAGRKKKNK